MAAALAAGMGAQAAEVERTPAAQDAELNEVVVFGRGEELIGVADAASEGAVAGADLSVRPMLRVAELLEAVPGMIAAQHSGSGKANQYFLRGFNLDHGTDFTAYVDGMPWNMRSHGHGQGYLDVNGLIPEVVDRIDYRKGPYRADGGDFALAGAAYMTTIDRLAAPFVAVEAGQYGWGRLAGGGTTELGSGTLTGLAQLKTYDGPWQRPEKLQHGALWTKYARDAGSGRLEVSLSGYHATWRPTEQSPEIIVGTAECPDRFCSLDKTATGRTDRWILTGQYETPQWSAMAYLQRYDWNMLSDPTYDYQIEQFDHRWTVGGRARGELFTSQRVDVMAGTELRYDAGSSVGVDHTEQGEFVENIGDNSIKEASAAAFSEATWRITDSLRLSGGLRADYYHFDVGRNAGAGAATVAGNRSDTQLSPKLALAWSLNELLELYGNWGRGFHSNDARGVVNPDPEFKVPGLVPGTGKELGARFEFGSLKLTTTYWWLEVDSELIFVGDSNAVEPKSGGRRRGLELVAFWKPLDWIGVDAVYTRSRARYKELQDPGDAASAYVEGAVESAGELGISAVRGGWEVSGRLRYLGPYPLVPDNSRRAAAETMVNLRLAYEFRQVQFYGELLNVFDHKGNDIRYYYATYVPGVTPVGTQTETYLSRAEEPRTFRLGIKYSF